jgi:hypothetical protein
MKKDLQPQLPLDETAGAMVAPAAEEIAAVDLVDDAPDVVTSDLRKFNRARAAVNKVLAPLKLILKISDQAGVVSAMEHMKSAAKVEKVIENKRKDLVKPYNDEVARINAYAKDLARDVPAEIERVKNLILDWNTAENLRIRKLRTEARDKHLLGMAFVRFPSGRQPLLVDHYHDDITGYIVHRRDLEEVSEEVWQAMLQSIADRRTEEREKVVDQLQQEKAGAEFFCDDQEVATIEQKIAEAKQAPAPAPSYAGGFSRSRAQGLTKRWTFEVTDETAIPRAYLIIDEKKIKEEIAVGARVIPGLRIYQTESITLR